MTKSKKRESAIKGKENKPSAISTGLFACERPRACVGIRKRLIRAAVEDALRIFCGTRRGKYCDRNLWAKFAWKFGWGLLRELTLQGEAEMKEHKKPVADQELAGAILRLIVAGKDYLVPTLLLIAENLDNREKSFQHMPRRSYFRHRDELLDFFVALQCTYDLRGRDCGEVPQR